MLRKYIRGDERVLVSKLALNILKFVHTDFLHQSACTWAARAELSAVAMGVMASTEDRREPISVLKLSELLGMPRPTLIRKLKYLEDLGVIETVDGGPRLKVDLLNTPEQLKQLDEVETIMMEACHKLMVLRRKNGVHNEHETLSNLNSDKTRKCA